MKLDGSKLEQGGSLHLGEIVNRFTKGQQPLVGSSRSSLLGAHFHLLVAAGGLTPHQASPSDPATPNLILATSSGRLASILSLTPQASRILFDLQRNMARVLRGPGSVEFNACVPSVPWSAPFR